MMERFLNKGCNVQRERRERGSGKEGKPSRRHLCWEGSLPILPLYRFSLFPNGQYILPFVFLPFNAIIQRPEYDNKWKRVCK